jgi:2-polyprenyl-3-methyl-5-hydroxy-6-metoxy-1,4-benzoquinol methylase
MKEPQYDFLLDQEAAGGPEPLGLMTSHVWRDDPKRLCFLLARYKFVAKMLAGSRSALEIGCADGFGTRLVRQEVPLVVATDFDPEFIARNRARDQGRWPIDFRVHDLLAGPVAEGFDGAYAVDVIEHIPAADEERFVANLAASLGPHGVGIVGTPSIQSQAYASPASREGHVNCKDAPGLVHLMRGHFRNVFVFSMNDEVVHTGFTPMAHYLFALCCGPVPGGLPRG